MHIKLDTLAPTAAYALMTQTIVPRPVAWVLTGNADKSLNLAPFSYFNAICSNPPMIMLSIGTHPDGREKDTRRNIEARSEFVVHIAHQQQAALMTATSASFQPDISELDQAAENFDAHELRLDAMPGSSLPKLAECRIAFACHYEQTHTIGNQAVIFAHIDDIWLDDSIVGEDAKGRLSVDAAALDPLGRLGGGEYLTAGKVITIERPQ